MLMLTGGAFLGLVVATFDFGPTPSNGPAAENPVTRDQDEPISGPWAESERSREILEGQENAPRSAYTDGGAPRGSDSRGERIGAVRVVDGDTFWSGSEKVRIADIDTPEVAARCAAEAVLAAQATRRTRALLGEGGWRMYPSGDRDRDSFGRLLRTVEKPGRSLGDMLIAEGLARPYAGGRRSWC